MRGLRIALTVTLAIFCVIAFSVWNNRTQRFHRNQIFRRVAECERRAPNYGQFSQRVETSGTLPTNPNIVEKVGYLKPGLTFEQVHAVLGDPSFNDASIPKDGDEYGGCAWDYAIAGTVDDRQVSLTDHLELTFDEADRLKTWARTDQFGTEITSNPRK